MAKRAGAWDGNVAGEMFVDDSCIYCGACFHMAPHTFHDADKHSVVGAQPTNEADSRWAHLAAVSCPVSAIGSDNKSAFREAAAALPIAYHDNIFWCGYTSKKSFGGLSWLIQRDNGNVLMDGPRYAGPLMKRFDELGGIQHIIYSHKDDIGDAAKIADYYQCPRYVHIAEEMDAEEQLALSEPYALDDDLLLIPTPGHTLGSLCVLHNDILFTGDNLWWNPNFQSLSASQHYCWFDWPTQLQSLETLLNYDFRAVLPGHGQPFIADTPEQMRDELSRALAILSQDRCSKNNQNIWECPNG